MGEKDKSLIPVGHYCYLSDALYEGPTLKDGSIPIVYCPYGYYKEYKNTEVEMPYCSYIEEYGISNNMTDDEFEKLEKHFGSADAIYDAFPGCDLLWDGCKECGENYDEDLNLDIDDEADREIIKKLNLEWMKRVKRLKLFKNGS